MSLTLAFNIARGSLSTNAASTTVVSRNLSNADAPDASRKLALVGSDSMGSSYLQGITNQIDEALRERATRSTSEAQRLDAIAQSVGRLSEVIGDPEAASSPAAQIGGLRAALQTASSSPTNVASLQGVLTWSVSLAASLNSAAELVSKVRVEADASLGSSVAELNELLQEFASSNREIVAGTTIGSDVTDQIDRRGGLLGKISELVDVRAISRGNNDVVLTLGNGVMLLDTEVREVSIDTGAFLTPGQPGSMLRVDGVPLSFRDRVGGKLGGLLSVRDEMTVQFNRQLDEVARGLVVATAESEQSGAMTGPNLAGLFTYPGGPALPPTGFAIDGLAAQLRVNPNVVPSQGGVIERIRDGGISGVSSYIYNLGDEAGFSDRLLSLIDGLSAPTTFDASSGVAPSTGGVLEFATASVGWLEGQRATMQDQADLEQVRAERAIGALQGAVGVNLDNELSTLMALERSYQASSRMIGTVRDMFDVLFAAVR